MGTCIICQSSAKIQDVSLTKKINCSRCGFFSIDLPAIQNLNNFSLSEMQIANISGWIKEYQNINIDLTRLEKLLKLKNPSLTEKITKLLIWLDYSTIYYGKSVVIKQNSLELLALCSICWAYDFIEIRYLLSCLKDMGFIIFYEAGDESHAIIKPHGYLHLENYKVNKESNIGFCAMWFDPQVNDVWEKSLELGIKLAGYEPKRIDKHPHNEGVVDEIISVIRRSKFVVADLTGHRNGVYFEAGFAKGLGIDVIFTCNKENFNDLHFDLRHFNFLMWEYEKYDEFKEKLKFRIEQTIGRGKS